MQQDNLSENSENNVQLKRLKESPDSDSTQKMESSSTSLAFARDLI